jgi:hypothetical protein
MEGALLERFQVLKNGGNIQPILVPSTKLWVKSIAKTKMVTFLLIKKVRNYGLDVLDFLHQEAGIQLEKHGELFKASEVSGITGTGIQVSLYLKLLLKWITMEDKV